MKTPTIFALAVLCGALCLAPAAHAQTGDATTGSTGNTSSTQTGTDQNRNEQNRDDQGPDLGWLGLLGLAGLAGLLKKPQREVVHQTDVRNTPGTPNVHK